MKATSVGFNGALAQDLMYRLGGLTAEQLATLGGLSRSAAGKTLRGLLRSKLADQRAVKMAWGPRRGRPRSVYYLSHRNYASGIVEGAFAAGVEVTEKQARARYARCQMPARAAHCWLRNELFHVLVADAEIEEGIRVDSRELWAESAPGFPLVGQRGRPIFPDGSFEVHWPADPPAGGSATRRTTRGILSGRFLVEAETRTRTRAVTEKVEAYASSWRERSPARARPVVFVLPRAAEARTLGDRIRGAARAEAEARAEARVPPAGGYSLSEYGMLDGELHRAAGDAVPRLRAGWFFAFVGLDELRARGAFAPCFLPLEPLPADIGGREVEPWALAAAGDALARRDAAVGV